MSDKPSSPKFAFVHNTSERLVMLRRPTGEAPIKGQPTGQEATAVGRGICYVRQEYVDANPDMGVLGLELVDPTRIPDAAVPEMLRRCTSRQALHMWAGLEKRPKIIDMIKARLAKPAAAPSDDE